MLFARVHGGRCLTSFYSSQSTVLILGFRGHAYGVLTDFWGKFGKFVQGSILPDEESPAREMVIQIKNKTGKNNGMEKYRVSQPKEIKKVLSISKLNVVGEKHTVSDGRRGEEIQALEAIGIPAERYWREADFVTKAKGVINTERYGDPTDIRIEQWWGFIKEDLKSIEQVATGVLRAQVVWVVLATSLQKKIKGLIAEVKREVELCKNRKGGLVKEVQAAADEILNIILPSVWELLDEAEKYKSVGDALAAKVMNLLINDGRCESALTLVMGRKPRDQLSSETVRRERSKQMHLAAEEDKDRIGVWKIGNQHVQDIREMEKDQSIQAGSYNLVNEALFNTLFERKKKGNEKKGMNCECNIF